MLLTVLAASAGCYLLKLAGLALPERLMRNRAVRSVSTLLPVAMLAALVAIQTFVDGGALQLDERAAGVGVAGLALALRAPFLLAVASAALTAGLIRLIAQ